jgi:hypothetical protein
MSSMKTTAILSALAFLTKHAAAHGHVRGVTANGQYFPGAAPDWIYKPTAQQGEDVVGWLANNQDNGFPDPVYDSPDMICHKGGKPGKASISVAAGTTIEVHWDTWPESHKGPVIDYLANANGDFASVDKESLAFVKIAEKGLTSGSWAADELIANNNSWAVTIPSTVAAGNYILRHEIIALHSAGSPGGAQNYPQCINVEVTGSGSDELSSGTLGTELYTLNEEGIVFNLYNNPSSYPIPGPALMEGGNAGGDSPSAPFPVPSNGTEPAGPTGSGSVPSATSTTTSSSATLPATTSGAGDDDEEVSPIEVTTPGEFFPAPTTTASHSFTSTATGRTGQPTKFVCYAEL